MAFIFWVVVLEWGEIGLEGCDAVLQSFSAPLIRGRASALGTFSRGRIVLGLILVERNLQCAQGGDQTPETPHSGLIRKHRVDRLNLCPKPIDMQGGTKIAGM